MTEEHLEKVVIDLSPERAEATGSGAERVWAKPLGGNLYEVRNVPWYATDINWGDVVLAIAASEDEWPRFVSLVRRGGHRTLRLWFQHEDERSRNEILLRLNEMHAYHEHHSGNFYAIDVEPEGDYKATLRFLDELAERGAVKYERADSNERE